MPAEDWNRRQGGNRDLRQDDYRDRPQPGDWEFLERDNRERPQARAEGRDPGQRPRTRNHSPRDDDPWGGPEVRDPSPRQREAFLEGPQPDHDDGWDRRRGDDDWHRSGPAVRRQNSDGPSRSLLITVSSIVVVAALAIGAGVVWLGHRDKSAPPSSKARHLQEAPVVPPKSWRLAFDSNFSGDSLDTKVFGTCYPWATGANGCSNYGNAHDQEDEWYLASQDHVSDGVVHLVAERRSTPGESQNGAPKKYECRSGMITTYPSFKFKYGYVQVVAKIPFGNGLWSGLWLAAANKKWPPEVDILEHWHSETYGNIYLHPMSGIRQGGRVKTPNLSAGYHTFTLKWTSASLVWYYDGNQVFRTTVGVPHQSMYLIANLADDSLKAGSCSGSMDIKSIKVWRP